MRARYGQHFLKNRGAIEAMLARFDPRPAQPVVEIGPGRGALTEPLVERAGPFAAIEIDQVLARTLARRLACPLLTGLGERGPTALMPSIGDAPLRFVLNADALDVRYSDLARLLSAPGPARLRIIGNLPYAVATALVRRMLVERDALDDALLMVQAEVADRILASPGTKAYGLISVLTALGAQRERVLTLAPGSFSPPPKVRSTVLVLRFHRPAAGFRDWDARLMALLKAAFSERRKKLATNLAKRFGRSRAEIETILAAIGVDREARAEALEPHDFARLVDALPVSLTDPVGGSASRLEE